jgi:hypothetical protein
MVQASSLPHFRLRESSRAYQALDHLLIAFEHAFVLMPSEITGPAGDVGTAADAIGGPILASQGCHGSCLRTEEYSGADEGDREENVPCHGLTS